MSENSNQLTNGNLYILTKSIDEGVMQSWSIPATDILDLSHKLVNNWQIVEEIRRNGWLSPDYEEKSAIDKQEDILKAISCSHMDGDSVWFFQLFIIKDLTKISEMEELRFWREDFTLRAG